MRACWRLQHASLSKRGVARGILFIAYSFDCVLHKTRNLQSKESCIQNPTYGIDRGEWLTTRAVCIASREREREREGGGGEEREGASLYFYIVWTPITNPATKK